MALRAVRSRQQAAAVGPYVRPAAAAVGRPLSTSSNSKSTDTAAFPLQKKFGQHLLKNPGILDKLLAAANITSSDIVLEIGPGTGNLTVRLLPLARRVVAMDIDGRMVAEVQRRCQSLGFSNLEVIHGDALRQDLGTFDVCAANLPYQISSPFLFKLLAHKHPFSHRENQSKERNSAGMLEQNHKVACAFKAQAPHSGTKFRDLCFEAVEAAGLMDRRSVSVTTAEFYKLLLEFHKRVIYFQNAAELEQTKGDLQTGSFTGVEEMFLADGDDEELSDFSDDGSENQQKAKNISAGVSVNKAESLACAVEAQQRAA
ncbi:hypothetical protein Emag_001237 [Eimeria magna]